jgi:hypothetical protein
VSWSGSFKQPSHGACPSHKAIPIHPKQYDTAFTRSLWNCDAGKRVSSTTERTNRKRMRTHWRDYEGGSP